MVRIGIDLGTTNSLGALVYDDGPHVIPRGDGAVVPSVVAFDGPPESQPPVVGQEADRDPGAVRSVKRLMGRTWDEALREGSPRWFPPDGQALRLARRGEGELGLELDLRGERRFFWPHELSALVLGKLRDEAGRHLGQPVDAAVVTVPAYFKDPHRQATLDAARLAGLDVRPGDLLDEPTAAALAFAPVVGFEPGEPVLVADWGGGTLDLSVLLYDGRDWMQAAIEGDLALGGDDVDQALARHVLLAAGQPEALLADERNAWLLRREARRVKELLSSSGEAGFVCGQLVSRDGRRLPPLARRVARAELEGLLEPLLRRAGAVLERCLGHDGVSRAEIRKVLLVGGSSRLPAFRALLARALPGAALLDDVDPVRSVALGAALYANARPSIARISPFAYSVRDDEGRDHPLIPANSEVPTPDAARFMFTARTRYPGQTVYRVTLVEKESPPADDPRYRSWELVFPGTCRRLFARDVPASPAGTRVEVEVWLDEHKTVQAACHLQGQPRPIPMAGREEGPDALFTRLLGLQLEAEALVEANPEKSKGLLPKLAAALPAARAASEARDRAQAEQSARRLAELMEQVEARQSSPPPGDGDHRARVMGWVAYYEQTLLPAFWGAIPPGPRAAAVESVRALRVMEQTGAPAAAVVERFGQLERELFGQPDVGLALRALHWSVVVGVPESLGKALRESALRLRDARLAKDAAGWEREAPECRRLLEQADEVWAPFHETDAFRDASPDLVLGAPGSGERGN